MPLERELPHVGATGWNPNASALAVRPEHTAAGGSWSQPACQRGGERQRKKTPAKLDCASGLADLRGGPSCSYSGQVRMPSLAWPLSRNRDRHDTDIDHDAWIRNDRTATVPYFGVAVFESEIKIGLSHGNRKASCTPQPWLIEQISRSPPPTTTTTFITVIIMWSVSQFVCCTILRTVRCCGILGHHGCSWHPLAHPRPPCIMSRCNTLSNEAPRLSAYRQIEMCATEDSITYETCANTSNLHPSSGYCLWTRRSIHGFDH